MRHLRRRYIVRFTLYTDSNATIENRWKTIRRLLTIIDVNKGVYDNNPDWRDVAGYFLTRARAYLFNSVLKGVRK